MGPPTQTPSGALFLHEKAAALFLEALWSSERKISKESLLTQYQLLKKGLRDHLPTELQPPWSQYKTSPPHSVNELFKDLAMEVALEGPSKAAKEKSWLGRVLLQPGLPAIWFAFPLEGILLQHLPTCPCHGWDLLATLIPSDTPRPVLHPAIQEALGNAMCRPRLGAGVLHQQSADPYAAWGSPMH